MTERGQDFVRRLSLVFIQPPKIKECERPTGPERSLDEWRKDIVRGRQDVIGHPGINLDLSPTGSGKSTADIEAVRRVGRALIVVPTHENCQEIEEAMMQAGIDAKAYPGRLTKGEDTNCWNELADTSEQLGLSAVAAVCRTCGHREKCLQSGYLAELAAAKAAAVAIATHARAVYNGLDKLAEGRNEFVSVHEDAANIVCPDAAISEIDLQRAADIINRVLNDPRWLDFLGQSASRDDAGAWVPNERLAETRNRLDECVRRLAQLIDALLVQLRTAERTQVVTMPTPIAKATGIESLLLRASLEAKANFSASPWRLLLAVLTGELFSLGAIATSQNPNEPMTDSTKHRKLAGVWKNLPNENAVVLFADATATRDDLEAMLGRPVIDITPVGHLANAKRVVQYPIDLARRASAKRFLSLIRGVLIEFPDARRVGIITHRPLIASLKKLGEPFAARIVKTAYFGSGSDRASNDWHERGDLVIVAGTPRVPSEAVQRRLIQFGDFKSAGEDGRWGPCRWKATTETGEELIVEGLGYAHPAWERAHRSLVRAAIIQAAGRGRSLLETGCDVVIISTEECSFPVVNNTDIEFSEAEANVLAVITDLSEQESYRSIKTLVPIAVPHVLTVSTSEVAHRMGLTGRGTQKILTRLESRRLICRVGERGGWLLTTESASP